MNDRPTEPTASLLPVLLDHPPLDAPEEARRSVTRYTGRLQEQLHHRLSEIRTERTARLGDLELGRTDVAPLVRSLAGFADVLDYAAKCFKDTARLARDEIGEEVRATGATKVVTPDGNGQEIVANITAPRSRKVDDVGLLAALYSIRLTEFGRQPLPVPDDVKGPTADAVVALVEETFRFAYQQAQYDVRSVTSSITPSVTKIDGLSRTLQAAGQDDLAGLLDRTMRWESGEEKVTVVVEDPKRVRRG